MAWKIHSDKFERALTGPIVLGRNDFPEDKLLSRRHIEISEHKDHVYVKDLGSTNGTFLRGERLQPHTSAEIRVRDDLRAGRTHFYITSVAAVDGDTAEHFVFGDSERENKSSPGFLARCIWVVLLLSALLDPSLAFGRSIGIVNLAILIAALTGATLCAALLWGWILRNPIRSLWRTSVFVSLAFASAIGFYSLLLYAINQRWPLSRRMATAKISYFCGENFNRYQCAMQTALCPSCVNRTKGVQQRLPSGSR